MILKLLTSFLQASEHQKIIKIMILNIKIKKKNFGITY